jgi:magnesium-transporting ATPase (P-type)
MNQQAIDYLQQNKDQYTQESLMQQLRSAGYAEADIQEAVGIVYLSALNSNAVPAGLPDQHQKESRADKFYKKATGICNVIEYISLPFSFFVMLMSPMAFDSPSAAGNPLAWLVVLLLISYPVILIVSIIFSKEYYKKGNYKKSFWISFIPAIPGALLLIQIPLGFVSSLFLVFHQ